MMSERIFSSSQFNQRLARRFLEIDDRLLLVPVRDRDRAAGTRETTTLGLRALRISSLPSRAGVTADPHADQAAGSGEHPGIA